MFSKAVEQMHTFDMFSRYLLMEPLFFHAFFWQYVMEMKRKDFTLVITK